METIKKAAKVLSGDNEEGARTKGGLTSTEKTTPPKPGDTILLTGATGFVAGHILHSLLKAGFKVKATVHSKEKADRLIELYPSWKDDLQVVVVEDIARDGSFDEAVKGVTGVVHTAYPHVFPKDGNKELLHQAVSGATGILKSIVNHNPDIRRVVLTSSFAAMNDQHKGNWPGHTYSEADWNPIKYEEALNSDHAVAHAASKTFAERAAWDFVSHHTVSQSLNPARFTLASILLPAVIGPIAHDLTTTGSINNSVADIYRLINGCENKVPMNTLWAWADVRDVANAHLAALLTQGKEAGVEDRFFAAAGTYDYQEICRIIEQRFPELVREGGTPHPTHPPGETPYHYKVNNSRVKNELGIKLRTLEESIVDTVNSLLDYEDRTRRGETREVMLAPVVTSRDVKGRGMERKEAAGNLPYSVGGGKTACHCGGNSGECTCAPGACACQSCAKNTEQREADDRVGRGGAKAEKITEAGNLPYSVGGGKTACNCGGNSGECTCAPGVCACQGCAKNTEQREANDRVGREESERATRTGNLPYSVGGGKTACHCGGNSGECTCAPGVCACQGCAKNTGQWGAGDRVSREGAKVEKTTEAGNLPYSVGGGKTACNCGGDSGECTCAPGACACQGCAKNTEQWRADDRVSREGAKAEKTTGTWNLPYSVGGGKTACHCGGKSGECTCPPETCACESCEKIMEQREADDKVSAEGERAAKKTTEDVGSEESTGEARKAAEHAQQSPSMRYAKLSGKIDCYCGRGEDNCICPTETCGCRGCAKKRARGKFGREDLGTRQERGGGVALGEQMEEI